MAHEYNSPLSFFPQCLTVQGMHNYSPKHLDVAVDFLAEHSEGSPGSSGAPLPFGKLVDPKSYPLEALNEAVDRALEGQYPRVSVTF